MNYLELETIFDKCLEKISGTPWIQLRLILLEKLVDYLKSSLPESLLQSYRLELYSLFIDTIERINNSDLCSITPTTIEALLSFFHPVLDYENKWDILQFDRFIACAVKIYIYLRAPREITSLLKAYDWFIKSIENYDNLMRKGSGAQNAPIAIDEIVTILRNNVKHKYLTLLDLKSILQHSSSKNSIHCLFNVGGNGLSTGIIAKLSLAELKIEKKALNNSIRISSHIIREEDILADQAENILTFLREQQNFDGDKRIKVEFEIDQPTTTITGNSIGLAMGILIFNALNSYGKLTSTETKIYSDIAITGGLTSDGKVISVDDTGLEDKIRAAFYSPIHAVIVPEDQQAPCTAYLEELQQVYPHRALKIIPAANYMDLQMQREITISMPVPMLRLSFQFIRAYSSIILFLLTSLVGGALIFLYFFYRDPIPVRVVPPVEQNYYSVRNKFGFELWKIEDMEKKPKKRFESTTAIEDIDNDGYNEVLIGFASNNEQIPIGSLICYNADGTERWRTRIGKKVRFGQNIYQNMFVARQILVYDFDHDGLFEIAAHGSHTFFPNRLIILDHQGKLLSDFWNSGNFYSLGVAEIDTTNSYDEIVVTGCNNEYNRGFLAVLDPFNTRGASPQQKPNYIMKDGTAGNELFYVLFPPIMNTTNGKRSTVSLANITDNYISVFLKYPEDIGYYEMSRELEITFFDLTDGFYNWYERQFPNDPLPEYNDPELIYYYRKLDYWDGKNWVLTPTINKKYPGKTGK